MADQPDFLTVEEVAPLLRISARGLKYRQQRGGDVPPAVKIGKQWLYPRRLVEEYIRQLEQRALAGTSEHLPA